MIIVIISSIIVIGEFLLSHSPNSDILLSHSPNSDISALFIIEREFVECLNETHTYVYVSVGSVHGYINCMGLSPMQTLSWSKYVICKL